MSRIPGVPAERAGLFNRFVYRFSQRKFGLVAEPAQVMAHSRGIVRASVVHEGLVGAIKSTLPHGLGELVQYRTATVLGCSWCVDFGSMLMRLDKLDVGRLADIDDYATSPKFDEGERLAIAYADAMTATPLAVTDEQIAALVEKFGHAGVVELTYLIALENSRGRFNDALGIVDQGFNAACAVPAVSSASSASAPGA